MQMGGASSTLHWFARLIPIHCSQSTFSPYFPPPRREVQIYSSCLTVSWRKERIQEKREANRRGWGKSLDEEQRSGAEKRCLPLMHC